MPTSNSNLTTIQRAVHPLTGAATDYDALLAMIGEARLVLLGEASHGTHEFYRERGQITKRLIQEKGFNAVAVEADWPDAYHINRYVRGLGDGATAVAALDGFRRFPTWMWRNADVLDFIGWLREYNEQLGSGRNNGQSAKVGFYGLDLYSLYNSIEAVLGYLDRVDPEAAKRARYRYACFETFGEDPQTYGYAASFDLNVSCEAEVVTQLVELQRNAEAYLRRDGYLAGEEQFYAEQNAKLVKNAEEYYRSMFQGQVASWNLRDRHMVDTAQALVRHLDRQAGRAKIVLWAHNSHLGDARATEMGQRGELNVGQLIREQYGRQAVLIGFSTNSGTVTAASDWGGVAERKHVRPALSDSYEALFHSLDRPRFWLNLRDEETLRQALLPPKLERAIGVIYRPETERISHYFRARLPDQFDALLHFDETRAVEPLERTSVWDAPVWEQGEVPETFPSGV